MNKKYFFFDIDGTLAYGDFGKRIISDSTRKALRKLEENGHFVAIATGRGYMTALPFFKQLGLKNMVSDGGNGLTIDGKLLKVDPLDKDKCVALINECIAKNVPYAFSSEIGMRRYTTDKRFKAMDKGTNYETIVVDDLNMGDYENIYKMYVAGNEDDLEALKDLEHCRYHDLYFFVEPTQKERGICAMMEYLGAPIKDVVVFGDGLNDLSMFRDEWTCIAMGNGADELKTRADYVTDDVDKDGIYKACVKYGWIEE